MQRETVYFRPDRRYGQSEAFQERVPATAVQKG